MKSVKIAAACCLLIILSTSSFESKETERFGKCAMPPVDVAFRASKAVFAGKVLSESKDGDVRTFEFQVEKYWKGVRNKRVKVSFLETPRYQAWFITGEKYLVFARDGKDGKLYDVRCSGTKMLSQASEDVKKLGRAKSSR